MNKWEAIAIFQLIHMEYGTRSEEFACTYLQAVEIFRKSILEENHEKNYVLVVMEQSRDLDEGCSYVHADGMRFSRKSLVTVKHFIQMVEDKSNG